ncbi:MAG: hypothetical protein K6G86_05765 [Bacteroidales bacterium]|nr:hypothetical protein [Bacteroidales bacterium]
MNKFLLAGLLLAASLAPAAAQQKYEVDGIDMTRVEYEQFREPARAFRGVRFIALPLDRATEASMREAVERDFLTDKWGTFVLIAGGGSTEGLSEDYLRFSGRKPKAEGTAYLSENYFKLYRAAIEKGLELGFKCSTLYDEWEYPSGMVEGLFYTRYPQDCAKSLEMEEQDVSGRAQTVVLEMPEQGIYVGAVAMNLDTYERRDVSRNFRDGKLRCKVPAGRWKVMLFWLDPAFAPRSSKGGFVDYLDRDAVAKYIDMSFGVYYAHLSEFFGTVVERTFYDEPTMMLNNGRMWTPRFNEGFQARYGYDPMTLYPALWYDIGPGTASARNALFGYRADLFAENYIGQVAQWCHAHGIKSGGHLDQEETRNPVGPNGDLMKAFKYQDIPATDDIYYPGRSNVGYKIVSSSAFNWDKPEMFTETFAAYSRPQYAALTPENYWRVSLDQLTMGTNIQIEFEQKIDGIDRFLGRGGYMLRGGRHVADVAVLYPIASLQAAYSFPSKAQNGHYYAYMGGIVPPETDYMDVGESLFRGLRVDYTYLHPEVLAEKCTVEGRELRLNNENNWEQYKVLVLPGGEVLSADAAAKILAFYRAGGSVIATSKLPKYAAEAGRDQEVRDMVYEVFGMSDIKPMTCSVRHARYRFLNIFTNRNEAGGSGWFIAKPYTSALEEILADILPQRDIELGLDPDYYVRMDHDYAGAVTYIHKVRGGKDIYFIANSTDSPVSLQVSLRGAKKQVELWDPQTGERSLPAEFLISDTDDVRPRGSARPRLDPATQFPLELPARSGMFVVTE